MSTDIAGVDRHGLKNILGEKFVNVQFDRSKSGAEILGCTVNNLLRGLFFINGNVLNTFTALDLPGGIVAWDDILETIYTTLSSIMTATEYTSRLTVLCKLYISSSGQSIAHMLSGAIIFTYTWTLKFNGYFSLDQLHILRLGVAECLSIIKPASTSQNTNSIHMSLYSSCNQLSVMLDKLNDERHLMIRGLNPSPYRIVQQIAITYIPDTTTTLPTSRRASFIPAQPSTATINMLPPKNTLVWNPRQVLTLPSLPATTGTVAAAKTDRRNTLREEFAKMAAAAATAQVELFGASSLLQNFSDSSDDEAPSQKINIPGKSKTTSSSNSLLVEKKLSGMGTRLSSTNEDTDEENENEENLLINAHHNLRGFDSFDDSSNVVRRNCVPICLPESFSLAQDSDKFDLWVFDLQEIARQWTLVDHALFLAIPMHALTGSLLWTQPRHRADEGAAAIRRFIDRFNATSLWATHSILESASPVGRANIFEKLVELAMKFEQLGNFSSVMAIVTALQQGCITRLTETKRVVKQTTLDKLTRLQRLMSGEKNYNVYRGALLQRVAGIHIPNEWIRRTTEDFTLGDREDTSNEPGDLAAVTGDPSVPHLGAHLAEVTGIAEGNPDYLTTSTQALNLTKLRLICKSVRVVARLQRVRYNIIPVRLLATIINRAIDAHTYIIPSEATAFSRKLFELSLSRESNAKSESRNSMKRQSREIQEVIEDIYAEEEAAAAAGAHDDIDGDAGGDYENAGHAEDYL